MKKNKYFFSVIVVFRNESKALSITLDNVIKQDYPKGKYELICVDDASSDNSYEIARKYTKKLIRFNKNVGISRSRNEAIKKSGGKFVLFLDGHMEFSKTLLTKLNNLFNIYPDIIGVCGSYKTTNKNDWNKVRDIRRRTVFRKNEKLQLITLNNFTTFSSAGGSMLKDYVVKAGGYPLGFENSAGEDTYLQIKLQNMGCKFLYAPEVKAFHEAHIDKKSLLAKLINEIRATGNILILGGENSLKIPYLNYFLSYPLTFLILLTLFFGFRNPIFLYLLVFDLLNGAIRMLPVALFKESSPSDKIATMVYLTLGELVKIFYLPYYILRKKPTPSKLYYVLRSFLIWEYQKWKFLPKLIPN